MAIDYSHCSNVTGSSSMCYNPYSQRSFVAQTNSKRDLALENYRDSVATKSASLEWSNTAPVTLSLALPAGTGPDGDTRTNILPQEQVVNPFTVIAIDTAGPVGNFNIITPSSIPILPDGSGPYFQFTAADGTASGYQAIKYLNNQAQLVEVLGEVTFTLTVDTTERGVGLTIYKNNLMIDPVVTEFIKLDMDSASDNSLKARVKLTTTLIKDDLLTLVAWRTDSEAGSSIIVANDAKLTVRSVI